MNKVIKDQLQKIKSCKVEFNDNSENIFIPKTTKIISEALEKENIYIIKLNDKALQPQLNSNLAAN